jgi:DnaJ-domain-containing protein 1
MKDPAEAVSGLAALAAKSKSVGKSDSTIREQIRALRKEKDQDELDRRNISRNTYGNC